MATTDRTASIAVKYLAALEVRGVVGVSAEKLRDALVAQLKRGVGDRGC